MKNKFMLCAGWILILLLTFLLGGTVLGNEQRVYDFGELFSGNERESLEEQIDIFTENTNMDMVILTTADTGNKSSSKYGEAFYIDGNFGIGSQYDGVLLLVDMDNRELWIKPVGNMNRYLTDDRVETMLDHAMTGASNGDFLAAAQGFIDEANEYYKKGIPQGQYQYEVGERGITWYEALIAVAAAFLAAFLPCAKVVKDYAMKSTRKQAKNSLLAYRTESKFAYASRADDLIDTRVTQMVIPRNTGSSGNGGGRSGGSSSRSTVHRSSGRSFGGGGRKF